MHCCYVWFFFLPKSHRNFVFVQYCTLQKIALSLSRFTQLIRFGMVFVIFEFSSEFEKKKTLYTQNVFLLGLLKLSQHVKNNLQQRHSSLSSHAEELVMCGRTMCKCSQVQLVSQTCYLKESLLKRHFPMKSPAALEEKAGGRKKGGCWGSSYAGYSIVQNQQQVFNSPLM